VRAGVFLSLFTALVMIASFARAQSYSLEWFTIDGGGGNSTGGGYSLSGTIGQPDAGGPLTGGNFTLTGGFWSFLSVVQTPGAPALNIALTTTNTALIWWPSPSSGWTLLQNTNLATTNWVAAPETVQDNGSIKFIIVNPPTAQRFYRLYKP
jgi:hypothetical protein